MLLPGVKEFLKQLTKDDIIIFTTARFERHRELTEFMLQSHNIHYKSLIMDLPSGCRILINDSPYNHLQKAISYTVKRDIGLHTLKLDDYTSKEYSNLIF